MIEIAIGLLGGATLGLCVAPLWLALQLPMRTADILKTQNLRPCAWALTLGAVVGSLSLSGFCPDAIGCLGMLCGGVFVGMLAAALTEAVDVVPVLFDRLSVTSDMRFAAAALAIGKAAGAIAAGLMGV